MSDASMPLGLKLSQLIWPAVRGRRNDEMIRLQGVHTMLHIYGTKLMKCCLKKYNILITYLWKYVSPVAYIAQTVGSVRSICSVDGSWNLQCRQCITSKMLSSTFFRTLRNMTFHFPVVMQNIFLMIWMCSNLAHMLSHFYNILM